MPNPTPPPPSSLPPKADDAAEALKKMQQQTEEALLAFEKFEALLKKTNELSEKSRKIQEKSNKLRDDETKALLERKKQEQATKQELKKLSEEYKDYILETGKDGVITWKEGTERVRKIYEQQATLIQKQEQKAIDAHLEALAAVNAFIGEVKEGETAFKDAWQAMSQLGEVGNLIKSIDPEFAKEMGIAGMQEEAAQKVGEADEEVAKGMEAKKERRASLLDVATEARTLELGEQAEEEKKAFESEQRAAKVAEADSITAADEMIVKELIVKGGLEGASDVKKLLDEFVGIMEDRAKDLLGSDATDDDVAKVVAEAMKDGRAQQFLIEKLSNEKTNELIDIEKKALEKIKEDRKVSDTVARQILERQKSDKSSDIHKELKKVNEKSQAQLSTIKKLDENQLAALSRADMARADDLEAAAEAKSRDPIGAIEKLGDRFSGAIEALKDTFGSIFKKDDGWLKTIAIVLTIVIGATLGYIWAKIKLIVGILSYIPGIGKYISGGFNALTGAFGGLTKAGGFLSNLAAPFKTLFGVLGKIFPSFAGFGGRLSSIFMRSFKVLGPIGLAITTLYDAISGAIKGFKEMGWKGVIMGAIAGIISGLTFGLVDFKTIFDVLKEYFGKFFDVINKLVSVGMWVIQPIIDAVKKVIGIFQGEGSIMGKIFKSIFELIKGAVLTGLRYLLAIFIKIPMLIYKGIYFLIEGIVKLVWNLLNWTIEKIAEGIIFIYDWFASGEWLGDLANLGKWIWEQVTSMFTGILDSVADALGEVPFIGDAIKGFLGGGSEGSEDEVKTTIEKASETTEKLVNETKATKEVVLSLPTEEAAHPLMAETATPLPLATGEMVAVPVTTATATQVARASAQASTAQLAATQGGSQSTAISAPTTNIVGGGGGGEPTVFMGSTSRNNDPTFRALLFLEQPAL